MNSTFSFRDLAFQGRSTGISAEPELSDWVSRVQGQGSDVTGAGVQAAVAAFIIGLKTDGLWPLAYRIGVYAGDALAALKAPLNNTKGDTLDTLTGFAGGDYTSTGLVGGTAGKRLETGLGFFTAGLDLNDFSMGVYVRTTGSNVAPMGAATSGGALACYIYQASGTTYCAVGDSGTQIIVAEAGAGFYLTSRIASNNHKLYRNGAQIGSTNTTPGASVTLFAFTVHSANNSASYPWPSGQSIPFYWFGRGLDATQQANLRTHVQTLQTSLSRQV